MTIKKIKVIGVFIIFGLSILYHFIYEISDNILFSFIFPVNESIWEHMKLLFTPFITYSIIEYLMFRNKIKMNNFFISLFIIPLISIITYLIIFLPIYNLIGENMIVSITLLFLVICLEEFISYKLYTYHKIMYEKPLGIIGTITLLLMFIYLTYYPFYNYIFMDSKENTYGIIND